MPNTQFQLQALALHTSVSELVRELYTNSEHEVKYTGYIRKSIPTIRNVVSSLSNLMSIQDIDYRSCLGSLNSIDIEEIPKDILFAKLVRYSSNIFCVSHMYQEEVEGGLLSHDLGQLLYFLVVLLKINNLNLEDIKDE